MCGEAGRARAPTARRCVARRPGVRRGIALVLVFLLLAAAVVVGILVANLMRGLQRQVEYSDAAIRAQYIGESAYHRLHARLCAKPWEARWFAGSPDSGSGIRLHGGEYDYFIADNPFRPNHADIFVRAAYRGTRRAFYWLVEVEPCLLVGLGQGLVRGCLEMEADSQPTPANGMQADLAGTMERIITTGQSHRAIADAMAASVRESNQAADAITKIGGVPPVGVVSSPFGPESVTGQVPSPTNLVPVAPPDALPPDRVAGVPGNERSLDEEILPGIIMGNYPTYQGGLAGLADILNGNLAAGRPPATGLPTPASAGGQAPGKEGVVVSARHWNVTPHRHTCVITMKDPAGKTVTHTLTRDHVTDISVRDGSAFIKYHSHTSAPPRPTERFP